jgi:acyl-coenzyme A thioesterase PaaI-like protein
VTPDELGAAMAASVPFVATVGYQIVGIDGHDVTVTLPNRPELHNHIGTAHAAAAYGAAETATGAVLMNAIGDRLGRVIPVLKDATVKYTAPAVGVVSAVAKPRQDPSQVIDACLAEGRALLDVDCTLYSEDGSVNAESAFTWYLKKQ